MRVLKRTILLIVIAYLAALTYRAISRKYYLWWPAYVRWAWSQEPSPARPVHLFFLYTDHFEPGEHYDRVERWLADYPRLANRHRDAGGRPVQHTWFYPAEQPIDRNLQALQKLTAGGWGETELHLHHGGDTQESTRRRFETAIAWFQRFGFMKGTDGRTHFAFIHGNWGLDNSRGREFCGANRELSLLRELGCFADFTFPSLWESAQPDMVNTIYMATDDDRDKSYDRGVPLRVGRPPQGDLLLFEGPLMMAPTADPRKLFFLVVDSDIHPAVPASPRRIDLWVKANVHVDGRPDWVFVKVHGHAASSPEEVEETLGRDFDSALSYLESRYNDGARYVLHYVTAREAYNVVRAAVDGKQGDPRQYYDYAIPRYMQGTGRNAGSEVETRDGGPPGAHCRPSDSKLTHSRTGPAGAALHLPMGAPTHARRSS